VAVARKDRESPHAVAISVVHDVETHSISPAAIVKGVMRLVKAAREIVNHGLKGEGSGTVV